MGQIEQLLSAPVSLMLLVANIGLSFAALSNPQVMDKLIFDVSRIRRNNEWYRWISSAFIHGGPIHLFFNMYALFGFGPAFENSPGLGPSALLIIYFGSLLGSSALMWLEHFKDPNYRALGASGAISGLLLAFAMFAPMAEFQVMFMFPMPAFVLSIVFIVVSAWASATGSLPGVAHAGHLGGALGGVTIVCIMWPSVPQHMIDQIVAATSGF
jgi:membrane associated rhomboid family serine protease